MDTWGVKRALDESFCPSTVESICFFGILLKGFYRSKAIV